MNTSTVHRDRTDGQSYRLSGVTHDTIDVDAIAPHGDLV
jgi:hypothetical protein